MDVEPEGNCREPLTSNPAASAPSTQATAVQRMCEGDAGATDRDQAASCKDNDLPLEMASQDEEEIEDEEEVFFGPVSVKEKQKASAYARRRTAIFNPGGPDHLRKRVTMAPSDLLPTLSEMGADDNSPSKVCCESADSLDNPNTENGCYAADACNKLNNGDPLAAAINCNEALDSSTSGLVSHNQVDAFEHALEPAPKDMERVLRRESLLVIQELRNHRKDGNRCDDHDCSLCILDDDEVKQETSSLTNGKEEHEAQQSADISMETLPTNDHCANHSIVATLNHSQSLIVSPSDNDLHDQSNSKTADQSRNQSINASDGYNSDDDFLLMEQSCHESFGEDVLSPEKSDKFDTTIECISQSINKLRVNPTTSDRRSVHAFSRYTPIRQAPVAQETFVAATPEEDEAASPVVTFTEKGFSPSVMFKDVRKPLLFNDDCLPGESHTARSAILPQDCPLTVDTNLGPGLLKTDNHTHPDLKFDGGIAGLDTTVDIIDVACHDKSCFDLNAIEGQTSSENSFEQDTSDSVCSSEEGSNKENQPQGHPRSAFQTPPSQRHQGLRRAISDQRPSSLHLRIVDDGAPLSPGSIEGASPMTMEEILARKKAQMQQLRQEQQKFTEKLSTRHSPSPARELGEKKGLMRSPLTGSFRSPKAKLPNTLPRVRYKDSHALALEGKQLDAVTKLHTMCNSQRSVKLINKPRKAHSTRIVTVVADERQRIKWSDLNSATPDKTKVPTNMSNSVDSKLGRRRSIIKPRPENYYFPYGDETPSSVIISKTAHHASSLQKAVIDKAATRKKITLDML